VAGLAPAVPLVHAASPACSSANEAESTQVTVRLCVPELPHPAEQSPHAPSSHMGCELAHACWLQGAEEGGLVRPLARQKESATFGQLVSVHEL